MLALLVGKRKIYKYTYTKGKAVIYRQVYNIYNIKGSHI